MTGYGFAQIVTLVVAIVILTPLLGSYIEAVFAGRETSLHPALSWLERVSYRAMGGAPTAEMTWKQYLSAVLVFNGIGIVALFVLLVTQHWWPLNPQHMSGLSWDLAFNTAVSFVTNTNWQSYAGETTLSYASQMIGLTVQNFLSATTGLCVLMALIRGVVLRESDTIGNFWQDLVRGVVYLFLPLALVMAFFLVSQGVIQNFSPYLEAMTLEGVKQVLPMGPVASQEAIKLLGTNGGGFFNANSAHPFENPTAWANCVETLAILIIPAALTYTYGSMIKSQKHGWLIFLVMLILWGLGLGIVLWAESSPNPAIGIFPSIEGREVRFGMTSSLIWAESTTATANGSVNAMMSSLAPMSGGVAMSNMVLGEVIFGGVGVGLAGMIMFILLAVFLCGLMVGRTPEYLGKKIEQHEIKWVMVAIVMPSALLLMGAGISAVHPAALSSLSHQGPHGLSELLYAFASAAGNNGSAFAGLNANTVYFNVVLGIVMLCARLAIIIPSLAVAGLLARKKVMPVSIGTFSTNTGLFLILLISVILIVGALAFFPALSLGPIVEHLLMLKGRTF